jgi:modulator of FtsH protease
MNAWSNFLIAEVGASAALTGLIFVGVSINLAKILSIAMLPDRALEALSLLLSALVVSSMLLVPGQSTTVVGLEVLGFGSCLWIALSALHIRIVRNVLPEHRTANLIMVTLSQIAVIAYVVSGALILSVGLVGMYLLVPAILLSIVKANLDAWVLLVEINR